MGFEELAAVENFRNGHFRGLAARVEYAVGAPIDFEVAWDTLAEGEPDLYHEAFSKVYFEPLIRAFQQLATDTVQAETVRNALRKIVIRNSGKAKGFSFENGILTIDQRPTTDIEYVEQRAEKLGKILKTTAGTA
jgi:hypothetical protein